MLPPLRGFAELPTMRFIFNQNRLETTLVERAQASMSPIEETRVTGIQIVHTGR